MKSIFVTIMELGATEDAETAKELIRLADIYLKRHLIPIDLHDKIVAHANEFLGEE